MINPKDYGLPPRTQIEEIEGDHWALIIRRKSRIIMADGRKILMKVQRIQAQHPAIKVDLKTNTPVCSKTQRFLKEAGVDLIADIEI